MTPEQKRNLAAIAVVGIAIYALTRSADSEPVVMNEEAVKETGNADAPGAWIPGVNLTQNIYGPGGDPFVVIGGDTNVNIPDFMLGSLSRQYIPMYGFASVTAVGAM